MRIHCTQCHRQSRVSHSKVYVWKVTFQYFKNPLVLNAKGRCPQLFHNRGLGKVSHDPNRPPQHVPHQLPGPVIAAPCPFIAVMTCEPGAISHRKVKGNVAIWSSEEEVRYH
jgi:hypothetical protein